MQDEKALHSKVGTIQRLDYSVTFRDTQDLEYIRRKLLKAFLILKSNADIGRSWETETAALMTKLVNAQVGESLKVVRQYIACMERHARVVDSLVQRLSGTSKLVG